MMDEMKTDIQFGAFDNEDEKIRTAILNHLKKMWANCQDDICGVHVEDAIDWLEKQGEHNYDIIIQNFRVGDNIKTTNEEPLNITKIDDKGYWSEDLFICGFDDAAKWELVEQKTTDKPKFHEGELVIDNQGIVHQISNVIENVTNHTYGYDIVGGGYFNDKTEGIRLWTVQDAKDGEILIDKSNNRECPFIFKEIKPSDMKTNVLNPLTVLGYCGIGGAGFTKSSGWGDTANCTYYPATKEQCDFLLQKMKEAGYEWDAEKKEVRKIEPDYPW